MKPQMLYVAVRFLVHVIQQATRSSAADKAVWLRWWDEEWDLRGWPR